ncbi:MAG: hypothetical protein RLZZ366_668 [Pseudomonadota bacterium]|jgi:hypothetical protein
MDGTGNFNSEDAAVETPINIGTDERRMHVRAYNYWVSLLDGRAYPSIEDLEPENLGDFGPNSVLLDFTGGIENPAISYLGNGLREECNLPVGVGSVAEIPSLSLLSRLTDHYLQIIANRAPIGFEAEYVNDRGNNTMYRGILMPFSSDDDTIDFIYGVINWKEVADDETTAGIVDEVERALQASPKRNDAPVAVWADGPSSQSNAEIINPRAGVLSIGEDDADELPLAGFEADGSEALGDWLAAARDSAAVAVQAESRGHIALYRALSQAYDFALVADARPEEYLELLSDSGIVGQERAPMTPIVKLVFGVGYDKTRLAEYGIALAHGRRQDVAQGGFQHFIESHVGGLKGIVQAERSARRPIAKAVKPVRDFRDTARSIEPTAIIPLIGEEEFVVLVARRVDGGHVAVIGAAAQDDAMLQKALRQLTH